MLDCSDGVDEVILPGFFHTDTGELHSNQCLFHRCFAALQVPLSELLSDDLCLQLCCISLIGGVLDGCLFLCKVLPSPQRSSGSRSLWDDHVLDWFFSWEARSRIFVRNLEASVLSSEWQTCLEALSRILSAWGFVLFLWHTILFVKP